ncbi:MAG TPA: T9SS type A sorting domain-containing protein [Bacteroidales bacterium]|nr:T9SS type A sorting domain-containing protein [Bacteroidales bacterium]HOH22118.1 T9SS type A sorting domain-containing protein [Bacteroidales bacterium]HPB57080.1 T9SS type A sorting domain-containing protein [Bacteroidales bacterium]HPZ03421.1 T9SS type A sorting domain-containing protein [Bacteroidales bacterium]HQB74800.1 T9SS type A sorting domain-containing protein [Bacteroidales bacterium]
MKRFLFIAALIFSSLTLLSQSYVSFFADTNKYNILHPITWKGDLSSDRFPDCVSTFTYWVIKTNQHTINDKTYYVSRPEFDEDNLRAFDEDIFIREDTTGKIFRYFPSIEDEVLICDMSLNQGDTFQLYTLDSEFGTEYYFTEQGYKLVVDSVTYENGRKIIHFPNIDENITYTYFYNGLDWEYNVRLKFIEGVGPTYGPFGFVSVSYEPFLPLLLCITRGTQLEFVLHDNLGCHYNYVGINDYESLKIKLYPNPSDGLIHLDLDENCTDCYVEVFNLLGVSVYSTTISESMTIDLSNNPAGIYFLSLRNKESVLGVKKVIIK